MESDNKPAVQSDAPAASTSADQKKIEEKSEAKTQEKPQEKPEDTTPTDPPADPPANPPADPPADPPANPPGEKPPKSKTPRAKSVPASKRLDAECAAMEKEAEPVSSWPIVLSRLETMRQMHGRYDVVVGQAPILQTDLSQVQIIWSDSERLLKDEVTNLQHGLGTTAAGRAFVKQTRARTPEATARAIISRISPKILGHNQALYKAMVAALSSFEKVDAQYSKVRQQSTTSRLELAYWGRLLTLSIQALSAAIRIAQLEQTMKTLQLGAADPKSGKKKAQSQSKQKSDSK